MLLLNLYVCITTTCYKRKWTEYWYISIYESKEKLNFKTFLIDYVSSTNILCYTNFTLEIFFFNLYGGYFNLYKYEIISWVDWFYQNKLNARIMYRCLYMYKLQ